MLLGQTVESFIDTIEYLISKGCYTIKAYPLRIPKNSEIESKRYDMKIVDIKNDYNISTVGSSYSFCFENRNDMERISERLNKGEIHTKRTLPHPAFEPEHYFATKRATKFQKEITGILNSSLNGIQINSPDPLSYERSLIILPREKHSIR